ncbi:hypothetical protein ACFFRR_000247 [Megaselia abdita]
MKIQIILICALAFCVGNTFALNCYQCDGDEKCQVIECPTQFASNYCYKLDSIFYLFKIIVLGVRVRSKGCTPTNAFCTGLKPEDCSLCDTNKCNGSGKIVANIVFLSLAAFVSKYII